MEISFIAEPVFFIGSVGISNAMLSAFVSTFLLMGFVFIATRRMTLVPTRLQLAVEIVFEFILAQLVAAFGSEKRARKFFPLLITILLFITVANQLSFVPLIYQVTYEGKGILRTATADLTLTLGLGLFIVVLAQILSFVASPIGHIGKYFKFGGFIKARSLKDVAGATLDFFLGLLDIIGEISKVMSLGFRLFGNVFAGEVLVAVIASLSVFTTYIVPVPFMVLSIVSGFIQAFVFTLLSVQFIATSLPPLKEDEEDKVSNEVPAFPMNPVTVESEGLGR